MSCPVPRHLSVFLTAIAQRDRLLLFTWVWIWNDAYCFYRARRLSLSPSPFSISRKQECVVHYVAIFNLVCRESSLMPALFYCNALHLGLEKVSMGHFQLQVESMRASLSLSRPPQAELHVWLNLPAHPLPCLITGAQLPLPRLQLSASGVPCPF